MEKRINDIKLHNNKIADIRRKQENELKGETHSTLETYNRYLEDHRGNHSNPQKEYDSEYLQPVRVIDSEGKERELIPIPRKEIDKLKAEKEKLEKKVANLQKARTKIVMKQKRN